jgi:chromosome segregation ATPase
MTSKAVIALCFLVAFTAVAESEHANPIRRVVTMLQNMQKRVEEEGKKETDLYEKYMCYCKNSGGDLSKSIADANTKIPQVASDIKSSEAALVQTKEDVKQAQMDRSAAKEAVATATALREKEAAAYAKTSGELNANINACAAATTAIEKGMSGSFLQTRTAGVLQRLAKESQKIGDEERDQLLAFLSGSQSEGYAPASGQIVGILKEMHDEFSAVLKEETGEENAAIEAYDSLVASKTKEINALTKAIETKMSRAGELAVKITQMKNDLDDTEQALLEDQAFLKDLQKNCATKQAEWAQIVKTRNEELVALAETIKVLNDDDALELFKKTLPSASASFMQLKVSSDSARVRALAELRKAQYTNKMDLPHLDFIALAIQGKKIGFEKVIKMIDEMVQTLKQEQNDDDHKKEYCDAQFDLADDKKKSLERSVSDLETAIEDTKEGIAVTKSDIAALQDSIKALDKSVADATEQRKQEHEDFTDLMASDSAAKELLGFAMNRLNKFYNPKMYVAPTRELSAEDRATLAAGGTLPPTPTPGGIAGTGITVLSQVQDRAAPPPPPASPSYSKKEEESTGVITMIKLLVTDLDKEMAEAQTTEKDSQADYETMMQDSASKRANDSKALADKQRALADMQANLESKQEDKVSTSKTLAATNQYIGSLHADCDWLLKYFDVRAEARASEVDALGKAKAVLSGADFSLVQTKSQKFLRSK